MIQVPRPVALLALASLILALLIAALPLGGVPHVPDEIAYTIQARIFAGGHRIQPLDEPGGLLKYSFLSTDGGLWAAFPPGWPALLAIFELGHLQILANPLLGAASVLLGWDVARRLCPDERGALYATAILALSPGFLLLSASRMAHTSALVAVLWIARQALAGGAGWSSGAALGYLVLARPFDAIFAGIPALLLGGLPDRRTLLRVGLPALLAGGLLLWDNALLTGSPWEHPASAWYAAAYPDRPGCNRLGFGPDVGCYPTFGSLGHTPAKAWRILSESARRFDRLLLGFPGGGLLALGGALPLLRRRPALVLLLLGVPAIHALYWTPGVAYGARFWLTLYLLAPAGLGGLLARIRGRSPWLIAAVLPLAMLPKVWTALGTDYFCVDGVPAAGLAARGIDHGVVFVSLRGQRVVRYPELGMVGMMCVPDLARGSAWALLDPRPEAGLRIRGLPDSAPLIQDWLVRYAPGQPAWLLAQDLGVGVWTLAPIDLTSGDADGAEPL